jgi:hypothetical protein
MSPFRSDLITAASLTYQLENVRDARKQNHAGRLRLTAPTEKLRKAMFDIGKTWTSDSTANVRRHINEELFGELFKASVSGKRQASYVQRERQALRS